MNAHRDIVANDWFNATQRRLGRVEAISEAWLQKFDRLQLVGDYFFTTDIHSDADCPFAECEELAMRPLSASADS